MRLDPALRERDLDSPCRLRIDLAATLGIATLTRDRELATSALLRGSDGRSGIS